MNLDKNKTSNLLMCRICLSMLKDQHFEITSTTFKDKSLKELIEIIGEITIKSLNITRHLCVQCCDNLCKFYIFRQQIQEVEKNLSEKCLTLIEIDGETKYCFTDSKVQVDKLVVVSDSKKSKKGSVAVKEVVVEKEVVLNDKIKKKGDILEDSTEASAEILSEEDNDLENVEEIEKEEAENVNISIDMDQTKRGIVYPCEFCHLKYTTIRSLCNHYKSGHGDQKPTFACDECDGKVFRKGVALKAHKIRVHSLIKPFACSSCKQTFDFQFQLRRHNMRKHGVKLTKCPHCLRLFTSTALLKKHINAYHEKVHVCQICNKEFRKRVRFRQHMKSHEAKEFACDQCNKSYHYAFQLNVHKRIQHTNDKPFLCDTCGKGFALQRLLDIHLKRHNMISKEIKISPGYQCSICQAILESISALHKHRLMHSMPEEKKVRKRVSCEVCGKVVTDKYMRLHMKLHGPTNYTCDLCGKEFKLKNTMDEHKKKVHFGISKMPAQCDICGQICATRTTCAKHRMNVHMGIYIKNKCTICNKIYEKGSKAKKHVQKMHPDVVNYRSVLVKVKIIRSKDS